MQSFYSYRYLSAIIGKTIGKTVIGKTVIGKTVIGKTVIGKTVIGKTVIGKILSRKSLGILLSLVLVGAWVPQAQAQRYGEDEFPPRLTLEDLDVDPLLPDLVVDRPLSPIERNVLRRDLDRLNLDAQAALAAGLDQEAFELWFREIRLRRYLGRLDEIVTLGEVGATAWNQGARFEVLLITERLVELQGLVEDTVPAKTPHALTPRTLEMLEGIALAYHQVRALPEASALYSDLAHGARNQDAWPELETYLTALGQVYLGRLKYPEAAQATGELLGLVRQKAVTAQQIIQERQVLEDLAFLQAQAQEWEGAIASQRDLISLYLALELEHRIPFLQTTIAEYYRAAGEEDVAIDQYKLAYRLAQLQDQFDVSQDILMALIEIYHQRQEPATVLKLYQVLVSVNRSAADDYGMMETYDRLGGFYLEYGGFAQALEVFRRSLALARYLDHREAEFAAKVEQVQFHRDFAANPEAVQRVAVVLEQGLTLDQALALESSAPQ
jgi:tetratricopeptide (TPR) repeat protein